MRIFVTVGNALVPFDRLLVWVDEAISTLPDDALTNRTIEGVCQHGPSVARPRRLIAREYLSRIEFEKEMDRADVVVCHAGVGTLEEAIRRGHRPLVVARRAAFFEIVNDHQLEIVAALEKEGRIEAIGNAGALCGALLRYARNETGRGAAREADEKRLGPVAIALSQGAARGSPSVVGNVVLRALASLAPPLKSLRRKVE